jgi:hypothetical protein
MAVAEGLRVLAVDDVPPALDELCLLLRGAGRGRGCGRR